MVFQAVKKYLKKVLEIPFGVVVSVETDKKIAALTFDDGPHPVYTPKLLDILARFGARATFFVVGEAAEKHPAVVQRLLDEGHEIANHTYDHPSLPTISRSAFNRQFRRTRDLLAPGGSGLMRPPYGHQTPRSQFYTWLNGYKAIYWSIDPKDWECADGDALARALIDDIRPGSIVLLHDRLASAPEDRFRDRGPTLHAVEEVLRSLRDYEFVTVGKLLTCGRPARHLRWQLPNADFSPVGAAEGGGNKNEGTVA